MSRKENNTAIRNTPIPDVTLRTATDDDMILLRLIYASTRDYEMAMVPWSDQEKEAFLDQQFMAQHVYYHQHYVKAAFDIIELKGVPIGRLYVDRRKFEIRIMDIAIFAEMRGRGLGYRLMKMIMDEAADARLPVRIHVERLNPAKKLYLRLGFKYVEIHGIHELMEWFPEGVAYSEPKEAERIREEMAREKNTADAISTAQDGEHSA